MDHEVTQDKRERRDAVGALRRRATDLDRIEMLAVALGAFAHSIPDYEPVFPPRIALLLQRHKY